MGCMISERRCWPPSLSFLCLLVAGGLVFTFFSTFTTAMSLSRSNLFLSLNAANNYNFTYRGWLLRQCGGPKNVFLVTWPKEFESWSGCYFYNTTITESYIHSQIFKLYNLAQQKLCTCIRSVSAPLSDYLRPQNENPSCLIWIFRNEL